MTNQPSFMGPSDNRGKPIFSSISSCSLTCSKRSASSVPSSSRCGPGPSCVDAPPRPLPLPRPPLNCVLPRVPNREPPRARRPPPENEPRAMSRLWSGTSCWRLHDTEAVTVAIRHIRYIMSHYVMNVTLPVRRVTPPAVLHHYMRSRLNISMKSCANAPSQWFNRNNLGQRLCGASCGNLEEGIADNAGLGRSNKCPVR